MSGRNKLGPHDREETFEIIISDGDGSELRTVQMRGVVTYKPPTPPSGQFGPPEDYDPGDGGELTIWDVQWLVPSSVEQEWAPARDPELCWADLWLKANADRIATERDCDPE